MNTDKETEASILSCQQDWIRISVDPSFGCRTNIDKGSGKPDVTAESADDVNKLTTNTCEPPYRRHNSQRSHS